MLDNKRKKYMRKSISGQSVAMTPKKGRGNLEYDSIKANYMFSSLNSGSIGPISSFSDVRSRRVKSKEATITVEDTNLEDPSKIEIESS